ncbi:MAG: sensor histidine kinase [Caulobacteraceae bacterium]
MASSEAPGALEALVHSSQLVDGLEGDRFKQILDAAPVAIAVAELKAGDRIVYANEEFERLTGRKAPELIGRAWKDAPGVANDGSGRTLGECVVAERDYLGCFTMPREDGPVLVDAWSSVIEDAAAPAFRLVALVEVGERHSSVLEELAERVREKDTQLRELQHRVKNNLQMITALIRAEAQGVPDLSTGEGFARLAGRIEALGVLYHALSESGHDGAVDLGTYLTQVASAVMAAHSTEGIHLDLSVDNWPVSIDVAMPVGLVVNELMTNALKHAFAGKDGGAIAVHGACGPQGCTVVVADNGVGLPESATWPRPGKLSSMIVRSLLQNAKATIEVKSAPNEGTRVTFRFAALDAAPASGADGASA